MDRRNFIVGTIAATGASYVAGWAETVSSKVETSSGPSSSAVSFEGKPALVTIDPSKTVVLVIDMQNDFGAKGGMFDRAGIDIKEIQGVVAPISRVLAATRKRNMKIVYLKMGFKPDLSDMGSEDSPNYIRHRHLGAGTQVKAPNGRETRILVRDTWGTDILDELKPEPSDTLMYKHRFSGFYQTKLEDMLRSFGARHLIVTGCTTSICVESTVRDAMFRDFTPVVLSDCSAEPIGHDLKRSNHEASLLNMQALFGYVADSGAYLKAIA
jgi:ureidoacrylate peracid hydrolase